MTPGRRTCQARVWAGASGPAQTARRDRATVNPVWIGARASFPERFVMCRSGKPAGRSCEKSPARGGGRGTVVNFRSVGGVGGAPGFPLGIGVAVTAQRRKAVGTRGSALR